MATNNSNLFDEFYNSYINCFGVLTNTNCVNYHEFEELKTSVEQCFGQFVDSARQLEFYFLQKRFLLSSQKPEDILLEDIKELEYEIKRKDEVIKQFYDKLESWKNIIADKPASSVNIAPPRPHPASSSQPMYSNQGSSTG